MFGKRLKLLRKELNFTQKELGEKLNISGRIIGYYESEERFPDKEILSKLADVFNVSVDYLLGRTNIRNTEHSVELELIEKLNFSDDIKEALRMLSELSPANQEKMMKIAKVFLEEEISEKK
ncbi:MULTISPECIES: helix-turn-helix domain-containing protein [unclassified Clostridioides]|uniref:helix-turn-helix domain-containing protein n=1 Tax=unclassified Clostridioides TaxID=2635829 RepID=UPI001A2E47D1|nr:helix-turn-helix transcriptional regulator [Clostridioides difficile]MCC0636843.1 helix-turn-helix transcriptional regulator [Clostridioides sp. ES-S-0001-02]MCC0690832.1 helix-turn-helix transcriptional regulator [Clostridioides sp. ZZV14-6387]MBJ8621131.1 helix-turn-helix transcriptional regulator [Clostridioides difficile]MBY2033084.1 helix-turn-helix domain-containing protein [Clostridioides difficile]